MYIFVIDTDTYAGNFEREMTAFITGCYGDCGVGAELVNEFVKDGFREGMFDDLVIHKADENGCHRPCKIWPTPGWFNDGLGSHYQDGQETEAKNNHRQKCLDKAADLRSIHPKDAEKHKKRWLDRADEPLQKFPAFNSVAIFLDRRPTEEEVRVFKERAHKWTKYVAGKQDEAEYSRNRNFEPAWCHLQAPKNITGFRLIEKKTEYTDLEQWEAE